MVEALPKSLPVIHREALSEIPSPDGRKVYVNITASSPPRWLIHGLLRRRL